MPFRPILTPAAPRWPPVAPLPRKSKFPASRLPVRQAATWAVSSKPSPLPANAIPSRCLTAPRSEVNSVTAAQMVPFDSVTFTGHFNSMTDVSTEVAKRAAEKGAKYYHVTRQWQNKSGGNLTVSADLFK